MEVFIKVPVKILNNPELVDAMATFAKNLYEKLLEKGFSAEAALQIVVAATSKGIQIGK